MFAVAPWGGGRTALSEEPREADSQRPTEHIGRKKHVHGNASDKNWEFNGNFEPVYLLRDENAGPEIAKSIPARVLVVHPAKARGTVQGAQGKEKSQGARTEAHL